MTAAGAADRGRPSAVAALVASCHPGPTAVVTAMAVALAVGVGRGAPGALAVGAAVLAGQLTIGWTNDALDAARDQAAGRTDKPVLATNAVETLGLLDRPQQAQAILVD